MNTFQAVHGTCFLLMTWCLCSCSETAEKQTENPIPIKEIVVSTSTNPVGNRYSGTVESETETLLSFSSTGTIRQLNVEVGDRVHRGQLVASIDPSTCQNAYDIAHSTRVRAEDAYQRMKQLYEKGSLSEIKWVEAQSQWKQAVASENIAKKNLDDCSLTAPCDGIVSETNGEVGQNVIPGAAVVKMINANILNVMVSVPESEIAQVELNHRASIVLPALSSHAYEGKVIEKGVIADPVSRSYRVKIRVENNDKKLLPGMVANVVMGGSETENVIVIPASLVQIGEDNSSFVWVNEDGRAARRTITCGTYASNGVTVTGGLRSGDRVICEGQQKVCTGTPVIVK